MDVLEYNKNDIKCLQQEIDSLKILNKKLSGIDKFYNKIKIKQYEKNLIELKTLIDYWAKKAAENFI